MDTFQSEEVLMSTNVLQIYKEVHMNLALSEIRLLNFENAIDILTALLHYDPEDAKALYLRGKSASAIREYELAINDFRLAKSIKQSESVFLD